MGDQSTYVNYLPPVLWEGDAPSQFSLTALLRVFEKLLSGIDDAEVVTHGSHEHDGVEEVIARLHRIFDPRYTPPQFLPWLASWVALEFPAIWDEYQKRKVTAEIAQIYRQRGTKEGLNRFLALYTVAESRPRIAVDDGSKLLFTNPQPGRFAPVSTLVAQGSSLQDDKTFHEGLVRPLCLAIAPDGSLIVGDEGKPVDRAAAIKPGVWQLPAPGRYQFSGIPAKPKRVGPAAWTLISPVAVVADNASPWSIYVLDNPLSATLCKLTSPGFAAATTVATKVSLGATWPVDMVLDTNGHLLILDRGVPVPSGMPATPKIIDVQIAPLAVTSHSLTQVIEPMSLIVMPNGNLMVGDAREQNVPTPADLVRIDRTNNANWIETRQLAALPAGANPLVAPTAIVAESNTSVFVLDLGLKAYHRSLDPPLAADSFRRQIAEQPAVFRVDLGSNPPAVTQACERGQFVSPTAMVSDGGALYIADRGEFSDPGIAGDLLRHWRAYPGEFGVSVYFSEQRPTTATERRQIVQSVREIVEREKPAHTHWLVVSAV